MSHLVRTIAIVWPILLVASTIGLAQVDVLVKLDGKDADSLRSLLLDVDRANTTAGKFGSLARNIVASNQLFPDRSSIVGKSHLHDIFVVTIADSTTLPSTLDQFKASNGVVWAIPNHKYSIERWDETYNDTHFDSLGHLTTIGAIDAWSITKGVPSVRIGIIDTGILMDHPDLQQQFWSNSAEDLNGNGRLDANDLNGIDDDGNGYVDDVMGYDFVDRAASVDPGDYRNRDPDASEDRLEPGLPNRLGLGHGTLVAGVAAAALDNGLGIAGVAPGSKLVPLRAFGADGLAEDDDVAAAIVYAAELGIDVVNLSFGDTYYSPLMAEAISYATTLGTIVVASGGNSGTDAPHYPSDYPEAIGALWLTRDGDGRGSRASFGSGIDVGAPGSFIYTTLLPPPSAGDINQVPDSLLYGYRSGSSVSAPQIAGIAALLRSVDPTLSPASVKTILTSTAVDLGAPGWDHETAAGLANASAALGLPFASAVSIDSPAHQSGFDGTTLEITGTVLNPLFDSYSVWFAADTDDRDPKWTPIVGTVKNQIKNGPLALWEATTLAEGPYLLRLEVNLKDGRTVEDRRRVFLDRTPPSLDIIVADVALVGNQIGIVADVESDDIGTATLIVSQNGRIHRQTSDRIALRHSQSLSFVDETGAGGSVDVVIEYENVAGMVTRSSPRRLLLPPRPEPGFVSEELLDVPAGFLMAKAADLDRDEIPEIVMNRYQDGWLGDTVRAYEWAGSTFRPAIELLTNTFPRDVGDTDGDGNPELLLQVSAVAQVIEFTNQGREAQLVFLDTAGINNPGVDSAAWGAVLADMDSDGLGEIIVHNRKAWRLLEYTNGEYVEKVRLDNPTPPSEADEALLGSEVNGFAEPEALLRDFDRDGREDLLVVDADGDFIVFESTGNDEVEPVWTFQTNRFTNQGSRFTSGDFDGDGHTEFVGFVHAWPSVRDDGEYEPPLGIYYLFEEAGDNTYELVDSLVVAGNVSNHGAILGIDLDGDDADELVIAHPPNLYVLKPDLETRWRLLYSRDIQERDGDDRPPGIRSIGLVGGDFDGNAIPEFIAAGANLSLYKFEWSGSGTALPAPLWLESHAITADSVFLSWKSSADSVAIYKATGDGTFDLLETTNSDSFVDSATEPVRYRLRGWHSGMNSAFTSIREVRPHAPAVILETGWVRDFLSIRFSEPLQSLLNTGMFSVSSGNHIIALVPGVSNRQLNIRFDGNPAIGDTLRWTQLRDMEGTVVQASFVLIPPRPSTGEDLFLTSWTAVSQDEALLTFNLPLEASSASTVGNYEVSPLGSVTSATVPVSQPNQVLLKVLGRTLGPTGLKTSIIVRNLTSLDGTHLGSEGTVATFATAAESTTEAYVFPNPYRATEHQKRIMIAGLPEEAQVSIYSPQGSPIRFLEEFDGDGGILWDLKDESGQDVPSGVYIVIVQSTNQPTVTIKAALLR